jgi:SSS family solute:Na+ symporter
VPNLADHQIELGIVVGALGVVTLLGFSAARWRRPATFNNIDEWGLGGRSFGPVVTWFLLGGELFTAYTFVALPALTFGVGGAGFFAVSFAAVTCPLVFTGLARLWSISHVHGLVTPGDFVRARYGSPTLALMVALTGIAATMPYIALQLIGIEAVFKTIGLNGHWPLVLAFTVLAMFTYSSGLRAPALISFVKAGLVLWVVIAVLLWVAMSTGGWESIFRTATRKFAESPSTADGVLLGPAGNLNYMTLVFGSALAMFLYPHAMTGILAARNRNTVRLNIAMLPIYTVMLGLVALVGFIAISGQITPLAGPGGLADSNTIAPRLFDAAFPAWCAGLTYAAVAVGALVPAAVMSIAVANLFTRNVYKEYLNRGASAANEVAVSRAASLVVKIGAVACIIFLSPQFSIDLQLIGGVLILQTLPTIALSLYTGWFHRVALAAGMLVGLAVGLILLYSTPRLGPDGSVVRAHFGSSTWALSHLGIDTQQTVYIGVLALAANLAVAVVATPILRRLRVAEGQDTTRQTDYAADEGDRSVQRLAELVDGAPPTPPAHHPLFGRHPDGYGRHGRLQGTEIERAARPRSSDH